MPRECATCGADLEYADAAVRGGEHHCRGCEDPLVEPTERDEPVEKRTIVPVAALMQGGDPR